MKKVDISEYSFGRGKEIPVPYQVRESMVDIILHPTLKLTASEMLKREALCERILNTPDNFIVMENADYDKLLAATNSISGYTRADMVLVKRIMNPEEVELPKE